MSDNHQPQQSNEQLKAQNLFAKWRKDETLYKEDEEKSHQQQSKQSSS
ncbi:hypothetical protein [Staphylococcus intermedius]|uniref:Uncharacterized protein n=2 Tax=Staphylococcus intermedius TaxID=1285 RepID=A0A380G718_STAIN|nr:hypothetical protein [Staphylococcus intermedius]SUM46542.1 Uncharacterised protein [Staphylococcus intermedius NCTC 11048]